MEEEKLNNLIYLLRIHHIDSEPLENLIKRNKDLEEENRNIKNHIYYKGFVELNYIPKSKIREKIEEYERKLKQPEVQNINTVAYSYYLGKKEGWEELLQEGDDK